MSLLSAQIVNGTNIILPWSIIGGFSESCTVGEFYDDLKSGKLDLSFFTFPEKLSNSTCTIEVGRSKTDSFDRVMPALRLAEVVSLFGRYIRFSLHPNEDESGMMSSKVPDKEKLKTDAFQILMNGSKRLTLPSPQNEENNKRIVYNKILQILEKAGLGFTAESSESGKNFLNAVTNSLWYVDPFIDRFHSRGLFHPLLFEHLVGFNDPSKSKHRKPEIDRASLLANAQQLDIVLEQAWINGPMWLPIKNAVKDLVEIMYKYSDYLKKCSEKVKTNHSLTFPVRTLDDMQSLKLIQPKYVVKPTYASRYRSLTSHLDTMKEFEPVCVDEYTPADTRNRRYYIDHIDHAISHKCILYRVAAGNSLGTHNFLWKIPRNQTEEDRISKNQEVIQQIQKSLPTYHTRAMRRAFIDRTQLMCSLKPMHARNVYRSLTGDNSAATNLTEKEVDERVRNAFDQQDPDIIQDLREHNKGQPSKYDIFFEKTKEYIESVVETAVDDRRHDKFTHLATAISIPDLRRQVALTCPPNTPIPSEQWLRFQFAPKNATSYSSLQYTGKLNVKFQVQSRQLRKEHIDMHYASAAFRYLKELSVKFREYTTFMCMDDKHHCKVGEPDHPVAAVDRGKRVIVGQEKVFAVSDHDFTKFSIVPSVTMLLDIPESIYGSFYRGQVYVGVKDLVLEPSSPIRHITEASKFLECEQNQKPILLIYTDGGPDHRLTYLSVQLSLICLFLHGKYDMLVAVRTPPMNSWKNPPERIMSILNLALQSVGLMRKEQSEDFEKKVKSLSSISQLRDLASQSIEYKQEMMDSIEPVKVLLSKMFERLFLKEKAFKTFSAASANDIKDMWKYLELFGEPIGDNLKQAELNKCLKDRPELKAFMEHCTTSRSYSFCIKKCADPSCSICMRPCLPPDVFTQLHRFPDPVPGEDGHYKSFDEVYGMETTEEHRPSLHQKATANPGHQIPFSPSAQTTKTVKCVLICTECEKPRVVYAANKLSGQEMETLERIKQLFQYTCGSSLQELKTDDNRTPRINALLNKCYVRGNITCEMALEVPYFSSGCFKDLCFHCGGEDDLQKVPGAYPICPGCSSTKTLALKRKHVNLKDTVQGKKKKN